MSKKSCYELSERRRSDLIARYTRDLSLSCDAVAKSKMVNVNSNNTVECLVHRKYTAKFERKK